MMIKVEVRNAMMCKPIMRADVSQRGAIYSSRFVRAILPLL